MADYGFLEDEGPSARVADVLNDKVHGAIPSLVHMHPDETVGEAIEVLREYGVSQMPIVKPGAGHPDVMAAEVVGSVVERELLDALFTQRASLSDPLEKHMSAPLPQVGSGEPVGDLMSVLGCGGRGDRPGRGQAHRRDQPAGPAGLPRQGREVAAKRPVNGPWPRRTCGAHRDGRDFAEVVRGRHVHAAHA